jgi:hypothetical protein
MPTSVPTSRGVKVHANGTALPTRTLSAAMALDAKAAARIGKSARAQAHLG